MGTGCKEASYQTPKIRGFHGDYEECRLLGCGAVWLLLLVFRRSFLQLLVAASFPTSLILSTVMMEAIRSSETSVLTKSARHHIPEDGILHFLNSVRHSYATQNRSTGVRYYVSLFTCDLIFTCRLYLG
jgi:hypothetical protein